MLAISKEGNNELTSYPLIDIQNNREAGVDG